MVEGEGLFQGPFELRHEVGKEASYADSDTPWSYQATSMEQLAVFSGHCPLLLLSTVLSRGRRVVDLTSDKDLAVTNHLKLEF